MTNSKIGKLGIAAWGVIFFGFLALDFFSKTQLLRFVDDPIKIIPGVLQIAVSKNSGVAFSIPIPNVLMLWLTPLLVVTLAYFIARSYDLKKRLTQLCAVLLLAGASGNYLDRLFSGAVTDFIDFSFWPSFNLADLYLTLGVFLLLGFYGKIGLKN